MAALHVRISDEMDDVLSKSAKTLDRPKGYLVRKALEAYLLELNEDIQDYNDALVVLQKNKTTIPWSQVKREYGLLD